MNDIMKSVKSLVSQTIKNEAKKNKKEAFSECC